MGWLWPLESPKLRPHWQFPSGQFVASQRHPFGGRSWASQTQTKDTHLLPIKHPKHTGQGHQIAPTMAAQLHRLWVPNSAPHGSSLAPAICIQRPCTSLGPAVHSPSACHNAPWVSIGAAHRVAPLLGALFLADHHPKRDGVTSVASLDSVARCLQLHWEHGGMAPRGASAPLPLLRASLPVGFFPPSIQPKLSRGSLV